VGRDSYDAYGERARVVKDPFIATARLPMHRKLERLVVQDIAAKLDLQPEDRLLDIGAGIGQLTIPLSYMVSEVTAVDHPDCLERLKRRAPEQPIRTMPGNWLDMDLKESFSKILVYDVIHYLGAGEESAFVNKTLSLLESRGRLLIGDVPSANLRQRFDNSVFGQKFNTKWNADLEAAVNEYGANMSAEELDRHNTLFQEKKDTDLVSFDDERVLGLVREIRRAGFQAWAIPQHESLPFATQREDILVMRP
jgi:2-polyprenyl-3-methyl-5-hydroxy-6-metoxy-1,4-benzoquinol methylase